MGGLLCSYLENCLKLCKNSCCFQADMARLGKYCTGECVRIGLKVHGSSLIGVFFNHNILFIHRLTWFMVFPSVHGIYQMVNELHILMRSQGW